MRIINKFINLLFFNNTSSTVKAIKLSFILKVFSKFFNFFIYVMTARILSENGFGIFSIVTSIIILSSVFTSHGLSNLILKNSSVLYIKKKYIKNSILFSWTLVQTIIYTIILVILIYLIFWDLLSNYIPNWDLISSYLPLNYKNFMLPLLLIIIISINHILQSFLRGMGNLIGSIIPEDIIRPVIFIFITFIFLILNNFIKENVTLQNMLLAFAVSCSTALVFSIYLISKTRLNIIEGFSHFDKRDKKWFSESVPLGLTFILAKLELYGYTLIIGFFLSVILAAEFRLALLFAFLCVFVRESIHMYASGEIAKMFSKKIYKKLEQKIKLFSRLTFIFSSIIFIFFYLVGDQFISILFQNKYQELNNLILILSFGYSLGSLFGDSDLLLNMSGNGKTTAYFTSIIVFISLFLLIIFASEIGSMGSAILFSFSHIMWRLIMWIKAIQIIKINSFII